MFFLFTFKNKEEKYFGGLKKKIRGFSRINFFLQNLKLLKHPFKNFFIIHKPSLWSRDVLLKMWARSVQPF